MCTLSTTLFSVPRRSAVTWTRSLLCCQLTNCLPVNTSLSRNSSPVSCRQHPEPLLPRLLSFPKANVSSPRRPYLASDTLRIRASISVLMYRIRSWMRPRTITTPTMRSADTYSSSIGNLVSLILRFRCLCLIIGGDAAAEPQ